MAPTARMFGPNSESIHNSDSALAWKYNIGETTTTNTVHSSDANSESSETETKKIRGRQDTNTTKKKYSFSFLRIWCRSVRFLPQDSSDSGGQCVREHSVAKVHKDRASEGGRKN